jgi:two-component system phosphate regulon sensor histidine kinase PhoR
VRFHSIRWRLSVPYILLILIVMVVLVFYLSAFVRDIYLSSMKEQLRVGAAMIGEALSTSLLQETPPAAFDPLADRVPLEWAARILGARVTIVDAEGSVLGESQESIVGPIFRPEVRQALSEGLGSDIRYSTIEDYDTMYVAVRMEGEGKTLGVVRLALPLNRVDEQIARLRRALLLVALAVTLAVAALSVVIAGRTIWPVRQLTRVAEQMAEGDLNARLYLATRDEAGQLADAFNHMADQLREKVTSLAEKEGRLSAILESMADGVIITDGDGQVRLINPAAARALSTTQEFALGRSFAQVVRHHQLIDLWRQCQERAEEQSAAVEVERRGLFVQAIVKPFPEGGGPGYLVILQDLTRVRRLETVRRDFISNISHELRTPLAGLKALVDTLRELCFADGAMEDPPAARRFLDRMEIEVDALTQMVEELLELSRIESGRVPLRLSPTSVADVVLPPVERLQPQAERAGLAVRVELPADLPRVLAEKERIQQVVTNLVHNAIKFTPEGGEVTVAGYRLQVTGSGVWVSSAGDVQRTGYVRPETWNLEPGTVPEGNWVLIAVRDTGIGIPPGDLDRIFERFYKADRARSGGGTGLGLAIAKHIVQGHGGQIWAESAEGKGSTFTFCLPAV